MEQDHHASVQHYIAQQRQAGVPDNTIMVQLIQAGWDHNDAAQALAQGVPQPPAPELPAHNYSQTGNTGVPMQVENVQYNMRVKTVESKIGLYVRLTMLGLWLIVTAGCLLLTGIINRIASASFDMGPLAVFAISLGAVATPVFIIANKKRTKEMARDPRLVDDLFYKKRVRHSLVTAVVFSGIMAFSVLYEILAKSFLHSTMEVSAILSNFVFLLGFSVVLWFAWQMHAKTQR